IPHRRDRGADPVLPRGLVRQLRRLGGLRAAHPVRALLVHAESARAPALAPLRQPPRPLLSPVLTLRPDQFARPSPIRVSTRHAWGWGAARRGGAGGASRRGPARKDWWEAPR